VYRARLETLEQESTPGDDAVAAGWFGRDALPDRIAFEGHHAAIADWTRESVTAAEELHGR
jgi:hypothetical protein